MYHMEMDFYSIYALVVFVSEYLTRLRVPLYAVLCIVGLVTL